MISLREVISTINSVKDSHIKFVGVRLKTVVSFYEQVFLAIREANRQPHMRVVTFTQAIMSARRSDLPDYKRLLQPLLKEGRKIGNNESIKLLKNEKNWSFAKKDIRTIIRQLNLLATLVDEILGLDICEDRVVKQQLYRSWLNALGKITFLIPSIFDYERWFLSQDISASWGPYQFTQALGLSTCPYCNRIYTYTIVHKGGQRIARPQLDHFLPKSSHPLMALSFFNLIPSCAVCNASIKGALPVTHDSHLSPYCDNPGHSLIRFSYVPRTVDASRGLSRDVVITVQYNGNPTDSELKKRVENFITLFCLREVYANHVDVVSDIIRKRFEAGTDYLKTMRRVFPALALTDADLYRYAYGTQYQEKAFHQRPLSKLTKDLAIELNKRPSI
jgi:hypothetical protein